MTKKSFAKTVVAMFLMVLAVMTVKYAPMSQADPETPCCESEFDWADPHADALRNHGLGWLIEERGIASALMIDDACGLAPAIGANATVIRLEQEYGLSPGVAGKVYTAAGDVCPEIP
jgi:hypothetical protein